MILIKGGVYKHVKSLAFYILIDVVQDTTNRCAICGDLAMAHNKCSNFKKMEHDDAPKLALYFSIKDRKFYARRLEEFTDGRFERT